MSKTGLSRLNEYSEEFQSEPYEPEFDPDRGW